MRQEGELEPGCRQWPQGTENQGALGLGTCASHAVLKPGAMGHPPTAASAEGWRDADLPTSAVRGPQWLWAEPHGLESEWAVASIRHHMAAGRDSYQLVPGQGFGAFWAPAGLPVWSSQGTFVGTSLLAPCFRCFNLH